MVFFTKDFLTFFKALRANNNRDWFIENKKRYEAHVKEPFKGFIAHMILKLRELDPQILITPKDAIFRIYRDIRFSKDKTPYKQHVSAVLSRGGRKDMTTPGIYLQLNDEETRIYSGVYKPDKKQLEAIRTHIARYPDEFKSLYKNESFNEYYGEIRGEKNKRLPKHFQEAANNESLICNKGFYYFHSLPPNIIMEDDFDNIIIEHYKVARPLNDFFQNAISGS
ncbi:MAG: DUF2461 domain-containing protein [Saprospiraceae bacterium]|nr:DUF2461 domain-containing protein [Saprospiraceae bacterium]